MLGTRVEPGLVGTEVAKEFPNSKTSGFGGTQDEGGWAFLGSLGLVNSCATGSLQECHQWSARGWAASRQGQGCTGPSLQVPSGWLLSCLSVVVVVAGGGGGYTSLSFPPKPSSKGCPGAFEEGV